MSGWVSDVDASASEASFPSLDNIYEEDEDSYISLRHKRTKATCMSSAEVMKNLNPDPTQSADRNLIADLYAQAELCRPSDADIHEVTQSDVTQPTENRRRKFLQLVKVCFSKDMTSPSAPAESDHPGSGNAAAVPDANNIEDSSFLDTTDDADLPTNQPRPQLMNDGTDDDSTYDLYASTLSRASASTKTSTIGDAILQESKMAAEMTRVRAAGQVLYENNDRGKEEDSDNQTLSTYSYRRAYADNITLGSAHTSKYSTITDDYSHEARWRIGMAEAVRPNVVVDRKSPSSPIDMDTGKPVVATKDDQSTASFPTPPPIFRLNNASNFNLYESHQNLHRIVSYGEGKGYVDEEAADRFASLRRGKGGSSGCCSWVSLAPREVKVMIVGSILMLLVSVISVTIGLMLKQEGTVDATGFVSSSNSISNGGTEYITDTVSTVPSLVPSATFLKPDFTSTGGVSSRPTLRSSQAPSNTRTTKPSVTAQVAQTRSPVSRTPAPSKTQTKEPTASPSHVPTTKPSASPVKSPTSKPTKKPVISSQSPSPIPTNKPSPKPSNNPTPDPSSNPTKSPSAQPIVEPNPTFNPTPPPSPAPTTRAPFHALPSLRYVIVKAAQDTYIEASSPSQNFGTSSRLRVDGSPERRTFIGFNTSRLVSPKVARQETPLGNDEPRQLAEIQMLQAKLRLFSVDDGGEGSVYFLPNTKEWDETLVTATSLGNGVNANGGVQVASYGDVEAYRWIEIDVTEAFSGGAGDFTTFAMKSESSDGVSFASRERADGVLAPELVLAVAGEGTLAPSPAPNSEWPTYAPTAVLSEDPTPKPSRKPTRKPTLIPTVSVVTTNAPTKHPSSSPTMMPKLGSPTMIPTYEPTSSPQMQTLEPTIEPSRATTKVIGIDPTFDSALCQTCPSSGTLFVAGSDCLGFWRCADGVRDHYHSCPDGTLFNSSLQICDHPYNTTCTCNP